MITYLKNYDDLNWDSPKILDKRYILYLVEMINERFIGIGLVNSISYNRQVWNPHIFSPNGILSWKELESIYSTTLFLASFIYFNPNKLNESNWKNGSLRTSLSYSLDDLKELTGFDFSANPFIPGQPILYYEKFLKPLKDILTSLTLVWNNEFYIHSTSNNNWTKQSTTPGLPTIEIEKDGETYTFLINGQARADFWSDPDNIINAMKEKVNTNSTNSLFGYRMWFTHTKWTWNGYFEDKPEQEFSCIKWIEASYSNRKVFRPKFVYNSGYPYKVYLIQNETDYPITPTDTSLPKLHYVRTPYAPYIEVLSGTTYDEMTLQVTFSENLEMNLDLSGIPVEDFYIYEYKEKPEKDQDGNILNFQRSYGCLGCTYSPIMVIDYSNFFILK